MKANKRVTAFKQWYSIKLIFILVVACSSILFYTACSDDHEDPSHCDEGFGPEGAVVEVTDLSSIINGVKITIPPGEVNDCANLWINEDEFFYFPSGFNPFDGKYGFKLMSYNIPEEIEMKIQLPTHGLEPHPTKILCAFYSDDPWDQWHIILPDEITNDYITFNVSGYHSEWSWGLVDIIEVDEKYIEPVLININGKDDWEAMKLQIEELLDSIVIDDASFSCGALDAIYEGIRITREEKEGFLKELQSSFHKDCGLCDATEIDFYNELIERIGLELRYEFTKMLIKKSGNWKVKIMMFCFSAPHLHKMYLDFKSLQCDHMCFYEQWTKEFRIELGVFLVTSIVQESIEYAFDHGYLDCPLPHYKP